MKCENCGCENPKGAARCECGARLMAGKRTAKKKAAKRADVRNGRTVRHSAAAR